MLSQKKQTDDELSRADDAAVLSFKNYDLTSNKVHHKCKTHDGVFCLSLGVLTESMFVWCRTIVSVTL